MKIKKYIVKSLIELSEICQLLDDINKLIIPQEKEGKQLVKLLEGLTIDELEEFVCFMNYGMGAISWQSAVDETNNINYVENYFNNLDNYAVAANRVEHGYNRRGTCGEILTEEKITQFILLGKKAPTFLQLCRRYDRIEDDWLDIRMQIDDFNEEEKDQLVYFMANIDSKVDWITLIHGRAFVEEKGNGAIRLIHGYQGTILPDETTKQRNEKLLIK